MRELRKLQGLLMLLLAVLFTLAGSNVLHAEEKEDDMLVEVYWKDVGFRDVTKIRELEGFNFDEEKHIITLNNYNGGTIKVTTFTVGAKIEFVIKGENTIHFQKYARYGIYTSGPDTIIRGSGVLNFEDVEEELLEDSDAEPPFAIYSGAIGLYNPEIIIDGPTININGTFYISHIYCHGFEMKSGTIKCDVAVSHKNDYIYPTLVSVYGVSVKINGGTIYMKYESADESETRDMPPLVMVPGRGKHDDRERTMEFNDCTVIVVGDKKVTDNFKVGQYSYYDDTADKSPDKIVVKNVVVSKSNDLKNFNPVAISKVKASLSSTKYKYDGAAKKPKVKVGTLIEGKDYTVKYINNVNPGKATVEITGKGLYGGVNKLYFTIETDGPKTGSKFNYKKLKYEIIKEGTKDGKFTGKVRVLGFSKKKLKKITIANIVKKNGVKYRVTEIAANAFKNNKKFTKVVIKAKKLKKIGKKAFYRKGGKLITFKC